MGAADGQIRQADRPGQEVAAGADLWSATAPVGASAAEAEANTDAHAAPTGSDADAGWRAR